MTEKEKAYLQGLIDQVLGQFKAAILAGRKIKPEQLNAIADGRIFTGAQAKTLQLVDEEGSVQTAIDMAGELGGLGKNPEIFEIPPERPSFMDFVAGMEEEDEAASYLAKIAESFTALRFSGQLMSVYAPAIPAGIVSSVSGGKL